MLQLMQSCIYKEGVYWPPSSINFYALIRCQQPFFMGLNSIFAACLWRL